MQNNKKLTFSQTELPLQQGGLCCKNYLSTEQSLQSAFFMQQLQKFDTRILPET